MGEGSESGERPDAEHDLAGEVVAGRYLVDKLIARGGFSSVYRATSTIDGDVVAIKVLFLDHEVEPVLIERFQREGELVARLESSNTVRIHERGRQDTYLYTVMEYIPGRSLYRQIKRYGALTPRQAAEIATQICTSLIEAHEHGFLHRDLKPSNIMMFRDDDGHVVVKVLDFGVAKMLEEAPTGQKLTLQGTFVGTPRYASPEQLRREQLSPRTDVYAVGLVMWESLVGTPAVPGKEYSEAVRHHLSRDEWTLPDSLKCPTAMRRIVEKSLAKSPERRYESCVELKAALTAWLQNRYGSAPSMAADVEQVDTRGHVVTKKESFKPESLEDLEAEDELFGEVIESSDAAIDEHVEVMDSHDLSESSAARASRMQIADRVSDHAGVTDADRPVRSSDASSNPNVGITIAIIVVAVLAGLYLFTAGANTDPEPTTAAPAPTAQAKEEPKGPVAPDSERGDGSPTLDAETIIKGMVASGWRVKNRESSKMDSVVQTNVLAEKDDSAASVTIYENETWEWADQFKLGTEPPAQAISFGRTVVRLNAGPESKSNGVVGVRESLEGFKQAAMARKGAAADPPEEAPAE